MREITHSESLATKWRSSSASFSSASGNSRCTRLENELLRAVWAETPPCPCSSGHTEDPGVSPGGDVDWKLGELLLAAAGSDVMLAERFEFSGDTNGLSKLGRRSVVGVCTSCRFPGVADCSSNRVVSCGLCTSA